MSRTLRPLAAAMGVVLVALALVASPIVSGAAGADSCRWTLHSKRVVKHKRVVRHGKKRTVKVKKLKKWWSCDAVADPPIEATPSNRLLVRALDGGPSGTPFHFQLSRGDVSAGDVTVQLNNRSGDGHDLHIRPADSLLPEYSIPELSPGNQPQGTLAEGTFNLTPGSWYMWCDLLDHEQWMHADLVVN